MHACMRAERERIAGEQKVPVARVVRDVVENYVEARYPLFRGQHLRRSDERQENSWRAARVGYKR
jgi:hypothetical protein